MRRFIVGLMSGTSLDGVDASLIRVEGFGINTKVEILKSISLPYEDSTKQQLMQAMSSDHSNVQHICSLNFKMSYLFADAVKEVCQQARISLENLYLIGSHGQTIYHIPRSTDGIMSSTLQICDASVLAYETGTTVVSNFRTMDIAAGGEGAPLIPYVDWLLFRDPIKGRILQNIGGIGNCTVIEKDASLKNIDAFDTGPGNMIIDGLCRELLGVPFDENGDIAEKGTVHHDIVLKWMSDPYFRLSPPKSTGREDFGDPYVSQIMHEFRQLSPEDFIATATYFTAYTIADAYEQFVFQHYDISDIIISGGGGNNVTLVKMIQQLVPDKNVSTLDQFGMSSDEKEAVGFGILANETIHQQKANVPSASGAHHSVILGQITLPPYGDHQFKMQ